MARKIKDLVKVLQQKDQNAEVEFVIVQIDGIMVCMDLEAKNKSVSELLKMFDKKSKTSKAPKQEDPIKINRIGFARLEEGADKVIYDIKEIDPSWETVEVYVLDDEKDSNKIALTKPYVSEEIKRALEEAVQVVAWRAGDISTEDGTYATTDIDAIIRLEQALCEALKTSSDDVVLEEILPLINAL